MKRTYISLVIVLAVVLGSCRFTAEPTSTLTPVLSASPLEATTPVQPGSVSPRPSLAPTSTTPPTPTAPPPTSTPTPIPPAHLGTPYPQPPEAITAENAGSLLPLARWGKGAINHVILSPDGSTLAAAGDLGIYLFVADALEQQQFFPTAVDIDCLAFSPDGQTLASGSSDGVLLWDLASGQVRSEMSGENNDYVNALAFSPDGSLLAAGTSWFSLSLGFPDDMLIDVWDPASGELLYSLPGEPESSTDTLVFSPNSELLVSGHYDSDNKLGAILLWDLNTQEVVSRYAENVRTPYVGSMAISPDGKIVAFGTSEVAITLWDTTSGAVTQIQRFEAGWIYSLAFSTDGSILAAGTQQGKIFLWGITPSRILYTLHTESGAVNSLAFSADGRTLYSGSEDGLRLWDASNGSLLLSNPEHASIGAVVSFSPDGKRLATYTGDKVMVWDASNGTLLQEFAGGKFVAISPDWSLLAAVSVEDPGILVLYDLNNGQLLDQISNDPVNAEISSMAFSPDGRVLAQVEYSSKNILLLWDTASGSLLQKLESEYGFGSAVAISPDGETLATVVTVKGAGIYYTKLQLWDVASGEKLELIDLGQLVIEALAFSPDGNTLAYQTQGRIILWDMRYGKLLHVLDLGINEQIAFSPDGRLLAAGGWTGEPMITLWDVATGALLASLPGHNLGTTGLAFSPDGRLLVSTSEEGAVLIWGVMR